MKKLGEKARINRLQKCYEDALFGTESPYELTDEWYNNPNDDMFCWKFRRPSEKAIYILSVDDFGIVTVERGSDTALREEYDVIFRWEK